MPLMQQEDSEAQYQSESQWLPHIHNDQVLQFVQDEERFIGLLQQIDQQLVRNLLFDAGASSCSSGSNSPILGNAHVAVFLSCCNQLQHFHGHFLNQLKKRLVQIEQTGSEASMIQLEETLAVTSELLSICRVVIVQLETRKEDICLALTNAISQSLDDSVLDDFVASKDMCLEEFVTLPCRRFEEILAFVQRLCQHAKLKRFLQGVYAHEIDKTKEFVERFVREQASLKHLLALQPSLEAKNIDLFGKKLMIEGKLRLLSKLSSRDHHPARTAQEEDNGGVPLKVYLFDDGLLLFSRELACQVEFCLRLNSENVLVEAVPSIVQQDNCLTNAFVLLHQFEKWMFSAEEAVFQKELMQHIEQFQKNRDVVGEINAQRQQATLVLPTEAVNSTSKAATKQTIKQHDVSYEEFNCVWVRRIWDLDLTVDLNASTNEDDDDEWRLMEGVLVEDGRMMVLLESQGWLETKVTSAALVVQLEKDTRLECFGNRTGQSEWQLEISNPTDDQEQDQDKEQEQLNTTTRIRLVSKDETRITFWYQRLADAISGLRDQVPGDSGSETEMEDVEDNDKSLLDMEESTESLEPKASARVSKSTKNSTTNGAVSEGSKTQANEKDKEDSTKDSKQREQDQEDQQLPPDPFVSVRKKRKRQEKEQSVPPTETSSTIESTKTDPQDHALSISFITGSGAEEEPVASPVSKRVKEQTSKTSPTVGAKSKKTSAATNAGGKGRAKAKSKADVSQDEKSAQDVAQAASTDLTPPSTSSPTPPSSSNTTLANLTPSQSSTGGNHSVRIMFTGLDPTPALKKQIKSIAGAQYVTDVEKATHLVVQSKQLKRTVKLLCGIAQCDHIVEEQWLENSAKAGFAVDEETFCLKDPQAERKWNFNLHHVMYGITKRDRQQLFGELDVFVTQHKSLRPPVKELVKIIQSAGGQVTTKGKATKEQVVISSEEALKVATVRKSLAQASPDRIYSCELILASILQQGIDWTQNQLSL